MPNNFKIIIPNSVYVSKAGNNSNDGLSPDRPKLTITAGFSAISSTYTNLIIGSGYYQENVALGATGNLNLVIGDGNVVVDGLNTYVFAIATANLQNITIKNCRLFNFDAKTAGPSTTVGFQASYVYFGSLVTAGFGPFGLRAILFKNCVFVNCEPNPKGYGADTPTIGFDSCVFINSSFRMSEGFGYGSGFYNGFVNNYVDQNSVIYLNSSAYSTATVYVNNNNIQGKIAVAANGAVSGVNSNGVPLSFAQHRIDYPNINTFSMSSDPQFNNPRILDYTLKSNSPNITGSNTYVSNIGGTEVAVSYTASSAEFTTSATSESLELRGVYYGISGSAVSGSITSGPMFIQWPRIRPMTSIKWAGSLEFDKSISASFAGNNNVPAYTTYTSASGNPGANPDRLKIQMRFSTQQTQPSTDSEWDNNGYWPAGTYQLFEINQKPKIDYKGTGNGDPTYVETSAIGDLVPSWVQTRIILRNDYNQ